MAGFPNPTQLPAGLGGPTVPPTAEDQLITEEPDRSNPETDPRPTIDDYLAQDPLIQKLPEFLKGPAAVYKFEMDQALNNQPGFWGGVNRVQNIVPQALMQVPIGVAKGAEETANAADWLTGNSQNQTHYVADTLPAQTGIDNLVQGGAQFMAPYSLISKPLTWGAKLIGATGTMANAGVAAVAGGLTGAVAFDPNDPDLANWLHNDKSGDLKSRILDFLQTNPADPESLNRLRQGITNALPGVAVDSVIAGVQKGFSKAIPKPDFNPNPGVTFDAAEQATYDQSLAQVNWDVKKYNLNNVRFNLTDWFTNKFNNIIADTLDENLGSLKMQQKAEKVLGGNWNTYNALVNADRAGTLTHIMVNEGTLARETFEPFYNRSKKAWEIVGTNKGALPQTYKQYNAAATEIDRLNTFAVPQITGRPGLAQALEPVIQTGHYAKFFMGVMAKRAARLKAEGVPVNIEAFNDDAIAVHMKNWENSNFNYKGVDYNYDMVADQLHIYNQDLLDFARQHGVISKETASTLSDAGPFIPFYRVFENDPSNVTGRAFITGTDQNAFKKLKGSEQHMHEDPMAALMQNTATIMEQATNNMARRGPYDMVDHLNAQGFHELANKFATPLPKNSVPINVLNKDIERQLKQLGISLPPDALDAAGSMTFWNRGRMQLGRDIDVVYRDGKPYFYKLAPGADGELLAKSMASLGPSITLEMPKGLMKVAAAAKRVLTQGATLTPTFGLGRNPIRDLQTGAVLNQSGIKNWSPFEALGMLIRHDYESNPAYLNYRAAGGGYNMFWRDTAEGNRDQFMKYFTDEGFHPDQIFSDPKGLWSAWMHTVGAVETAPRFGEYLGMTRKGAEPAVAATAANNITTNFGREGAAAWVKTANATIPFLRAGLAGMYRTGQLMATAEGRALAAARFTSFIVAPTMAIHMINHNDERYQALPDYIRDNNWVFIPDRIPGAQWMMQYMPDIIKNAITDTKYPGVLLLTAPFELGAAKAIIERGMDHILSQQPGTLMDTHIHSHDWANYPSEIGNILWDAFHIGYVPQLAKPLVDVYVTNQNFLGGPIETDQEKQLYPWMRTDERTSQTMTQIGQLINQSPKQLEYLWDGYTSSLGRMGLAALDYFNRNPNMGAAPSMRWDEYPVLEAFLKETPYKVTKDQTEFYRLLPKVQMAEASFSALKKSLEPIGEYGIDDFLNDKAKLIAGTSASELFKAGSNIARQYGDDMKRIIGDQTMDKDEKREAMDAIYQERGEMFKKIMDIVRHDDNMRAALLPSISKPEEHE